MFLLGGGYGPHKPFITSISWSRIYTYGWKACRHGFQGLDFLIRIQKPNGDLRGQSLAVGMYCHAMATLAMCEAYALTADERLKKPAAQAIAFLVDSQAEGGAAWRYEPARQWVIRVFWVGWYWR